MEVKPSVVDISKLINLLTGGHKLIIDIDERTNGQRIEVTIERRKGW